MPLTDVRVRRHVEALVRPDRAARRAVQAVLAELVEVADAVAG